MRFVSVLFFVMLLTGCSSQDAAAMVLKNMDGIIWGLITGALGPIAMQVATKIWTNAPRAVAAVLEAALPTVITAVTAYMDQLPSMGLPALAALGAAFALRAFIYLLQQIMTAKAAADAGNAIPTVGMTKAYLPQVMEPVGRRNKTVSVDAVTAGGQSVTVSGFSPWSK